MKKTKVKIPAKLNLTLDVLSKEGEFHNLKSLVCSIDIYDTITLKARKDKTITLKEKGIKADCDKEKNNAYLTAKTVLERYSSFGVDITVNKNIPVGAGLGGSSADVAGVLIGYDMMLGGTLDLYSLAKELGSDVNYMLGGGYAVISGKGDDIEFIESDLTLYFIIIPAKNMVSAKDCFLEFDKQNLVKEFTTDKAVSGIKNDKTNLFKNLNNNLYGSAIKILPEIKVNYELLSKYSIANMTGSGSAVYAVFESKKERDKIAKILKKQKVKFITAKTV